jgi:hypothetical protein
MKNLPPRRHEGLGHRLARLLRAFAFLLGAGGIAVLGLQAIAWFRNGVWMDWTLLELWLSFGNSFSVHGASAVDRIWLQLLDLPAGPILLALGLALLMAARSFHR